MMHCVDCPLGWQYHWPVGSGQLTRKEAFKQLEEKQEAAAQADAETEDSWRYVLSCRKCFCFLPASLDCYVSWRYALSCHKWFWTCLPLWTAMCLHSILCASFVFWLAGGMRFHAVRWIAMCLHSVLCASFVSDLLEVCTFMPYVELLCVYIPFCALRLSSDLLEVCTFMPRMVLFPPASELLCVSFSLLILAYSRVTSV